MNMDIDSSQQWGSQEESDQHQHQHQHQSQAKVSKLQLMGDEQEIHASALPLFAATPINHTRTTSTHFLTPFPPDSSHSGRFSWGVGGMVGLFSLAQWQELELQALIYKYMLAGAPVPLDLILPIRKSLLSAYPYYHHHHQLPYQHFSTAAMVQSGYWGRCMIDPEPGRCRRTDGKKWRCSREVVPSHKYCERHVHRGRNRSRKHVELPTPSPTTNKDNNHFTFHHQTSRATEDDGENKKRQSYCSTNYPDQNDGHVLRKFFNERPRSQAQQESISSGGGGGSQTLLSISIPGDVSLKLSTGSSKDNGDGEGGVLHPQESPANPNGNGGTWSEWGNGNIVNDDNGETASGGPLAEALLRSSTSTASPTSVLQKPSGITASETSSISISS